MSMKRTERHSVEIQCGDWNGRVENDGHITIVRRAIWPSASTSLLFIKHPRELDHLGELIDALKLETQRR